EGRGSELTRRAVRPNSECARPSWPQGKPLPPTAHGFCPPPPPCRPAAAPAALPLPRPRPLPLPLPLPLTPPGTPRVSTTLPGPLLLACKGARGCRVSLFEAP